MNRPLIGDANLLVRTGIRTLLTETFVFDEIGEATCAAEALANLRTRPCSLCVLDVSLPERGGLEIARHVRKARSGTGLLFLSSRADRQYVTTALKEGARGFILRDCSRLSISPKSVSTYRARILEKTRCRNNAEITRYAIREGLI